jgi:hypothetical protein
MNRLTVKFGRSSKVLKIALRLPRIVNFGREITGKCFNDRSGLKTTARLYANHNTDKRLGAAGLLPGCREREDSKQFIIGQYYRYLTWHQPF